MPQPMGPLQLIRHDALDEAARYALRGDGGWEGLCLKWVRSCFDIPARYPSAIVAWNHVAREDRHGGKRPPAGVPVFWAIGKYGHIALSDGDGRVWSTDIRRRGKVDRVTIDYVNNHWGARYLGWSETLNGKRVISNREAGA